MPQKLSSVDQDGSATAVQTNPHAASPMPLVITDNCVYMISHLANRCTLASIKDHIEPSFMKEDCVVAFMKCCEHLPGRIFNGRSSTTPHKQKIIEILHCWLSTTVTSQLPMIFPDKPFELPALEINDLTLVHMGRLATAATRDVINIQSTLADLTTQLETIVLQVKQINQYLIPSNDPTPNSPTAQLAGIAKKVDEINQHLTMSNNTRPLSLTLSATPSTTHGRHIQPLTSPLMYFPPPTHQHP